MKITAASPISGPRAVAGENVDPGLVIETGALGIPIGVVTGNGVLGVKSLQMEGRRPVSAEEFLRGHRDFLGSWLPS